MTWDGEVSAAVIDALAAAGADGRSVQSGALVARLADVDVSGDWTPLWLMCGAPEQIGLASIRDPETPAMSGTTWYGVRVSGGLGAVNVVLASLDERYGIEPLQPAMLLVAVLLAEWTGASHALRYHGETTTATLVEVAQDILGTRLDGVLETRHETPGPTGARVGSGTEFRLATASARDDLDLLLASSSNDTTVSAVLNEAGLGRHLAALLERARPLGSTPAESCLERVRQCSLAEPEAFDVAVFVLEKPSVAMDAALRAALATGPDLAVLLHLRRRPARRLPFDFAATTVDVIVLLALMFLIVRHALTAGPIWTLTLLPLAWVASNEAPLAVTVVAVGILFRYTDTPTFVVALASLAAQLVTFHLVRFETLATTGIRLSRKDRRRVVLRRTRGRLLGKIVDLLLPARMESLQPRRKTLRARQRSRGRAGV